MNRSGAGIAALALSLLASYAAAASGAVAASGPRVALVLAGLLLLPGLAPALWLSRRGECSAWEIVARAAGLGLALQAIVLGAAHLLGARLEAAALWLPAAGAVAVLAGYGLRRPRPSWEAEPESAGSPWSLALLPLLAAAAWAGSVGPPLGVHSDSLAHVALVRRAAMTGSAFPLDAFYADAGGAGADPRSGLFHALCAVVVRVTDLEPVAVWRWGSLVLAPLLLLSIHSLARAITGRHGPAVLAAALALVVHGGGQPLLAWREAVYPARVADALVLLALASGFRHLQEGGWRPWGMTVALGFAAVTTHVFAAVSLAVAFAATLVGSGLSALTRAGRTDGWATSSLAVRGLLLAGGTALGTAPYLWWRYRTAYAPADPIHLEPQGLLYWGDPRLFSVTPESFWSWLGWPSLLLPLAGLWLWRERRRGPGYAYLSMVALAIPVLVLHPLLLPTLYDRLGYLVARLVACIPVSLVLAVALWTAALARRARQSAGALWMLATALAVAVPQAWTTWTEIRRPPSAGETADRTAQEQLAPVFARLREEPSGPLVLAADPATSYFLPGHTGHFVVAVMPQHGSPNDARGEDRIVRAREILSPHGSAESAVRLLAEAGADALLLDLSHTSPLAAGPWVRDPAQSAAILAKFATRPERFRLEPLADRIWLVRPAGDAWRASSLLESEAPQAPEEIAPAPSRSEFSLAVAVRHEETQAPAGPVRPGDSLTLETVWRRIAPLPPGLYVVEASLAARPPRDALYRPEYGKLYRRVREAWTRERRWAESNHLPADGLWPPETWPQGELVREAYSFPVPEDLQPGVYELRLRFRRLAHHPNRRIEEYWREDAAVWGPPVARVEVGSRETRQAP